MTLPRAYRSLLAVIAVLAMSTPVLRAQERLSTPEYRYVCEQLVCQCGCNSTVATCAMENCHSAEPIREEVAERLENGESPASILNVFRERYGLQILAAPPASGFHLTAWVMPFIALVLGAIVIAMVLRSWRRRAPAGGPEPDGGLSDYERARIERELRDFSS
jgi:cytochrome c-type biogenesis protein CcmH